MATQTAQAQAILDARVQQTGQAVAALTAYPMTATPLAETQAALLLQQYDRERQSFEDQVVIPLIPFMIILVIVLLILGVVLVYRRLMQQNRIYRPRYLPSMDASPPLPLIDAVIVDQESRVPQESPRQLPEVSLPDLVRLTQNQVEIVEATEPPFSHWISDLEYQLAAEGKQAP